MKHRKTSDKAMPETSSVRRGPGGASKAYGNKASICVNTDCTLRKKAGGCSGFAGCPGFKSR